jgi:tRNA threonylcarbamoyladenosine biosynthesis protein TsaB
MERGHQERLAPLVRELAEEAGIAFATLDRIGVTVGPGSFTGLRVGLAFAKGMGLALQKPVVGVGTLEALAATAGRGLVAAAIDARREQVYLQVFRDGEAASEPEALTGEDALERVRLLGSGRAVTLAGSGARLLADGLPGAEVQDLAAADPLAVARLAWASEQPARPLYLRAPDAKLPAA